tara:strand:+ start:3422 stop:3787 length:366 start_codon:yes stop_codon:yes gene_type:complete
MDKKRTPSTGLDSSVSVKNIINRNDLFLFLNKLSFDRKYIVPSRKGRNEISAKRGNASPPKKISTDKQTTEADMAEIYFPAYIKKILYTKYTLNDVNKTCVISTDANKFPSEIIKNGTIKT